MNKALQNRLDQDGEICRGIIESLTQPFIDIVKPILRERKITKIRGRLLTPMPPEGTSEGEWVRKLRDGAIERE